MGFNQTSFLLSLLFLHISLSAAFPHSIQILPENRESFYHRKIPRDDYQFCDSWRFTVETNDASPWTRIPSRCVAFVQDYVTGDRYLSDSEAVASQALAFANTVKVSGNGKDAWVFDIDETLLSNVPYYAVHGFGSETFDEHSFDEWVDLAEAPALPASLRLYKELEQLGFKIFLLTGRSEFQRNVTEKNLEYSGYSNWERLILRGPSDKGKPATTYKSEKRKELEDEGYTIHGSSGDQMERLDGIRNCQTVLQTPKSIVLYCIMIKQTF